MTILYTIGFTKKPAEEFFSNLKANQIERVIDVRLNNTSQLAGFSKRDDLKYFLRTICGIDYMHLPQLAPTQELLQDYRKNRIQWNEYEREYTNLIRSRGIETEFDISLVDHSCLLCSEDKPDHCHRRLVAEYLRQKWADIEIVHL